MTRYPVPGKRSIMQCPVHSCSVALDADGRVNSPCPRCVQESFKAQRLLGVSFPTWVKPVNR